MPPTKTRERPTSAVFADGSSKRSAPLAIHPEAIGVSYDVRPADEIRCARIVDGVAVLSICGPLEHKSASEWWSYWQTYEAIARDFNSLLSDGSVRAVVLKFDSPGGECAGLNETVAIMQAMKAKSGKPVVAYVDEACYSAAYALAMVADEIYLPESGGVGSIGVITAMCDVTKMNEKQGVRVEVIASGSKKTDGHPAVALTDGAIKRTRRTVDKLAASFFELVATSRGLDVDTVAGFEAGTFTGQEAVDVGLADGVMSLHDCLTFATNEFSSSNRPTDRSAEEDESIMPPGKLAVAKALTDANRALAAANAMMTAAKTDGERALAAARIVAAEEVVAKVKKTKTVTTDTHEEEVDDGEEETAETAADDGPPPSDDDKEDDEDEDAEKSAARSSASVGTTKGLLALARRITGKHSIDEVMGALRATWESSKKTKGLAAEVAALKADAERGKVSALVASGLKSGKLAPSQRAWAKTQTPASLKAYLDAAPRMVHTPEDEHTEASVEGAAPLGSVSAEMAKIWRKQGFAEKDFPGLLAKMNGSAAKHTTNGAS